MEGEVHHAVKEPQDERGERAAEEQQEEDSRYHAAEERQVIGAGR